MGKEKEDWFDIVCATPFRCFLFVFGGSYLLWWLVLDGPKKWDNYFKDKEINIKNGPVLMEDPLKLEKK